MAQQTSVEWYLQQVNIYGDKAFNREITLGEFHIKKQELIAQAKENFKGLEHIKHRTIKCN
jgi:hypothetical protein